MTLRHSIHILLIAAAVLTAAGTAHAQKRGSAKSMRTERQRTQKEITQTRKLLEENQRQTRLNLEALEGINAGIVRHERQIARLEKELGTVTQSIAAVSDSVARLNAKTDSYREDLKKALVSMREHRKAVSGVAFIFSAPSFTAATKRLGYIRDINTWRMGKIEDLRSHLANLEAQKRQLQSLESQRAQTISSLGTSRQTLQQRREQQQAAVSKLRREGSGLNALLSAKQKRLNELNRELDRIIAAEEAARRKAERERQERAAAEERRRAEARRQAEAKARTEARGKATSSKNEKSEAPARETAQSEQPVRKTETPKPRRQAMEGYAEADRRMSGSFEANRGRLLFPVAGSYSVVGSFGRTSHHNVSSAQVNNSGIDIAAPRGAKARAVFQGTVSSIFYMPGYDNIVIIRHGRYLTVYAGIRSLSVKKGSNVDTGTVIGSIGPDADDPQRCMLHFEVRREREKLNPLEWVK